MKTNFYILLLLLLSFSFANAQANTIEVKTNVNDIIVVSDNDNELTTAADSAVDMVIENETVILDASKIKEAVARGTSDIRMYLNRIRNVENINILFPNLNKAVKA